MRPIAKPALILLAACASAWPSFAASFDVTSFDAASVKPSDPNFRNMDFRISPGGRLVVTNWTLALLIGEAYGVKLHQITGGPAWLSTGLYDITAKADGDPSRNDMMAMLRQLLADRFQLQVQREMREGIVYALSVAKNGPKLVASKEDDADPWVGIMLPKASGAAGRIMGIRATIPLLADRLSTFALDHPVVDQTGIAGFFDFTFEYGSDESGPASPALATAIQESLGLKLEARKGAVETIVVDHAEKPSAN
jgi:uncharacterized protein (TIGR03435 family)